MEKDVDRVAKKLGDKYTRAVNRTIRTTIPDGHQQQCEEYVGVVHVYKVRVVPLLLLESIILTATPGSPSGCLCAFGVLRISRQPRAVSSMVFVCPFLLTSTEILSSISFNNRYQSGSHGTA